MVNFSASAKILLLVIGFGSGLLPACFGVGGGIFLVPALHALGKIPLKSAVGTSLAIIAPTALIGAITETIFHPENLRWGVALLLAMGSMCGTFLGKALFHRVSDKMFAFIYAAFLLIAAFRLMGMINILQNPIFAWADAGVLEIVLLVFIGIFAGISSTFFGIGGGIITTPALLICFQDFVFHVVRSISLLVIIPTSGFGAWHHYQMGSLEKRAIFYLLPTAMTGAVIGIFLVQKVSGDTLQKILAILLVLTAWRLLRKTLRRTD